MSWIGPAISAGAGLVGSGLDFFSAAQGRAQQNSQFQQSAQLAQQQFQFQMDAAKQGIQWRVADAKAAGISPLVALGAPTFNPGGIGISAGGVPEGYSNMGATLGKVGQDISNAIGRNMTPEERAQQAMTTAIQTAQIAKLNSETEVNKATAASVTARMAQANMQPPFPAATGTRTVIPGQQYDSYKFEPSKITSVQSSAPSVEAGPPAPSVQWQRQPDGSVVAAPTNPAAIANPGILNPEYLRFLWQNVVTQPKGKPPESMLPPGAVRWRFSGGAWYPTAYWPGEREARSSGRLFMERERF
ncbi:DNA pilot protein [Microvirus D_HF4_329]|nr:DNA pilot protein [Microvirus D_HF4_329]